jgi:H+-transporting ATPase
MAIAYDNTKLNKKPVRWDMKEVFVLAGWLWLAWVLSSFTLFIITKSVYNLPIEIIQSLFFVKLIVAWHWTIFNTRTDDWFFKNPIPSKPLFISSLVSALIWTLIWVYGFWFMTPIWWTMAWLMWAYALSWFLFNDVVKILVVKYYRKYKNKEI